MRKLNVIIRSIGPIFSLGMFLIVLPGCKDMDPNPELKDPVYLDLKSIADKTQKDVESEGKNLQKLITERDSEPIRSLSLKLAKKKVQESKAKLRALKQKAHFYKVRAERRRILGRKTYKLAFLAGETWPDPKEIKYYKINKKLRAADLNWNKRVPKLIHANPNYAVSGQKPPKEEK